MLSIAVLSPIIREKKYYFDIFLTKMLLLMKIMLFLRDINRTWKLLI